MKFYIVNDVDRPCERLLAYDNNEWLYYFDEELSERYKHGFSKERATPVEAFGMKVTETGNHYIFEKICSSFAKYNDGSTREWQDETFFTLKKRTE